MTSSLMDILFGCRHKSLSFPMTSRPGSRRSAAASVTGTYVVCLDCGREFPYDWQEMKIIETEPLPEGLVHDQAESYAAK